MRPQMETLAAAVTETGSEYIAHESMPRYAAFTQEKVQSNYFGWPNTSSLSDSDHDYIQQMQSKSQVNVQWLHMREHWGYLTCKSSYA